MKGYAEVASPRRQRPSVATARLWFMTLAVVPGIATATGLLMYEATNANGSDPTENAPAIVAGLAVAFALTLLVARYYRVNPIRRQFGLASLSTVWTPFFAQGALLLSLAPLIAFSCLVLTVIFIWPAIVPRRDSAP